MTIRALHDHVIVEREGVQSIIEIVGHKDHIGRVVAVGPGKFRSDPETGEEWFCPMTLKPGDRVMFSHRAGMERDIEGRKLLVMHEADILCALDPEGTVGMGDDWRPEQSTQIAAYDATGGTARRIG